jgi:dihydroneopterin aldolase
VTIVRIELAGLELEGFHGVTLRELQEGQRFLFDVELDLRTTATESDGIADTVDYRDVVACVREISDGRAYALLEALAATIADELIRRFPLERVRVRVRKPDVTLEAPVEYAAVSVERAAAPEEAEEAAP